MNRDNVLKKLKKIQVLVDSFEDNTSISSLERDLLLSYIRNLYDVAMDDTISKHAVKTTIPAFKETIEKVVPEIKPIIEIQKVEEIQEKPLIKEEIKIEAPIAREIEKTKVEEIVVQQVEVADEVKPKPKPNVQETNISPDVLNDIFKEGPVSELSDKLGMSHIDDIRKGMGLNERLFTQKELFGDNTAHFNEVLDTLNKVGTYEEAKAYLIEKVIPVYKWDSESNIKKAATFVKLVRRKFY